MPVYKAETPLYDGNTIIDSSLMKQMVNDFNEHFQNEQINYYHYGTFSGNSFTNIGFEDITLMVDIDILDTPKGKIVQKLLEHDSIMPTLNLIKHDGKLDIHSVSLNINNENYENR